VEEDLKIAGLLNKILKETKLYPKLEAIFVIPLFYFITIQ